MACALATDIRIAYEGHDRDALERALERVDGLVSAMTRPCHMDPAALERRRAELQAELNAIERELERRADVGRRQLQANRDDWVRQNPEPSQPLFSAPAL